MRLVFVDDPSRLGELHGDDMLVATEPEVEIAAETQGLDFVRFWAHVDPLALESDGEATYEPLTRACRALDSEVAPGASASWHLREVKVVVDGVRSRWLAVEALVAALGPTAATLRLREATLTYEVLACGLPALGLEVQEEALAGSTPTESVQRPSFRSRVAWHLRRSRRRGSPLVLCTDTLYGIEPLAAALRSRGADVRLLLPAPLPARAAALPGSGLEAFRELFAVGGADLSTVGLARISTLLERGLAESAAVFRGACSTFRRMKPDAVVGSAYESPRLKAIAAAAHAQAVPVFVSRHGEMGIRRNTFGTYQDLDAVDVALCWGAWEARQVAAYAHRPVQPVVVGSPSMEAEVAPDRAAIRAELGFDAAELVVLYLPAGYGAAWVASRRAPTASDLRLHQRAVLAALTSLPGITPVLKMPPAPPSPIVGAWLLEAAGGARQLSDVPYSELIHLADAVVIEFPSTTLVQALRGSARIFVLDHPVIDWMPGVREHLADHGVVFVGAVDLRRRLGDELAGGRLAGPHSYPRDALDPLLASGPGTAADRAADAVLRIIGEVR